MMFLAKYGEAADFYGWKLLVTATNNFKSNPTLASGDVKLSKDGGSLTNLATLPNLVPAASTEVHVALSASELQCKIATINFIDVSGAEWLDNAYQVFTFGHPSAFLPFDFSSAAVTLTAAQVAQLENTIWDAPRDGHTLLSSFGEGVRVAEKTGFRLSADGINDLLRTALTEGYAADGVAPTLEQFMFMLFSVFAQFGIAGTTITCQKLDGVTTSMTFTTYNALNPTSRVRTG